MNLCVHGDNHLHVICEVFLGLVTGVPCKQEVLTPPGHLVSPWNSCAYWEFTTFPMRILMHDFTLPLRTLTMNNELVLLWCLYQSNLSYRISSLNLCVNSSKTIETQQWLSSSELPYYALQASYPYKPIYEYPLFPRVTLTSEIRINFKVCSLVKCKIALTPLLLRIYTRKFGPCFQKSQKCQF